MIAQALAQQVIDDMEPDAPLPIDIYGLIRSYNIHLRFDEFPEGVEGAYIARPVPIIIINDDLEPGRKRFAAGHELYHHLDYTLSHSKKAARFSGVADTKVEREANLFSALLLMPEPAVKRLMKRRFTSSEIARVFGVPESTLEKRVKLLGKDSDILISKYLSGD